MQPYRFEFPTRVSSVSSEVLEAVGGAFDDVSLTTEFPIMVILDFAV